MSPKHSCIRYWKQLNFKSPLTAVEHQQIEHISMPEIYFDVSNADNTLVYSRMLKPQEFLFAQIVPQLP